MSFLFSFIFPAVSISSSGSEIVILEKTCCRLEIPDSFSRVENIRMKLNPRLARTSSRWLWVGFNFFSLNFDFGFCFLISNY